jgi:hypothetical protein
MPNLPVSRQDTDLQSIKHMNRVLNLACNSSSELQVVRVWIAGSEEPAPIILPGGKSSSCGERESVLNNLS